MFVQALVGVTAAALLTAAPAQASNWICSSLDSSPRVSTVENIVMTMIEQGYNSDNGGEYLAESVVYGCPEYIPVVQQFIDKWS